MASKVNRLRNPKFDSGKGAPTHWILRKTGQSGCRLIDSGESERFVRIQTGGKPCSAFLAQDVPCLPEKFYRVDAVVACEFSACGEGGGVSLRMQPLAGGKPAGEPVVTPAITSAAEPVTIRAYWQAPPGVRRVRLAVGLCQAGGRLDVYEARFMRILEPEHQSHPFAILPPEIRLAAPRRASSLCICTGAPERPLVRHMREALGHSNVSVISPASLKTNSIRTDALLLPDDTPPSGIRSMAALKRLATDRYVVVGVRAFGRLAGSAASVRRVEQPDDPIHARVLYANHATRGLALNDVFSFCAAGRHLGGYRQNQFRKTKAFQEFCKKHKLRVFLDSLCDRDATSYQPVALCQETPGGGLYVIDLDPVEQQGSTLGEPVAAMHILQSLLGRTSSGLGQYFTPISSEPKLREMIREFGVRFESARIHDGDVPSEEVTEQMVTIGGGEHSFGLPLRSKPVILIRSGVRGGDAESVFGAFLWIKNLIRPADHAHPYAQRLISKFRIAWMPAVAPWKQGPGWARSNEPPWVDTQIEAEPGELAAVIDLVSRPINRNRVVFARGDAGFDHAARWLPAISTAFAPEPGYTLTAPAGAPLSDCGAYTWSSQRTPVEVIVDPAAFTERIHQDALAAGAGVIRLEIPGWDADFAAQSIRRTANAAVLLEHVIGLQYGLIAVNRGAAEVHYDGLTPLKPGECLVLDPSDPLLRAAIPRAS